MTMKTEYEILEMLAQYETDKRKYEGDDIYLHVFTLGASVMAQMVYIDVNFDEDKSSVYTLENFNLIKLSNMVKMYDGYKPARLKIFCNDGLFRFVYDYINVDNTKQYLQDRDWET